MATDFFTVIFPSWVLFLHEQCRLDWILELVTRTLVLCRQYWTLWFQLLVDYYQTTMQPKSVHQINIQFTPQDIKILTQFSKTSPAVETLLSQKSENLTQSIRDSVPDYFLLQFAALNGDRSAKECLDRLDGVYNLGKKASLFGMVDSPDFMDLSWESRVNKRKPGLTFNMERKPWRNGLYLYKTRAVFEECDLEDFKRFVLDSKERLRWDWSLEKLMTIPSKLGSQLEDVFVFSEHKMPCPFANREYLLAKRVWNRSDDGIYCISNTCTHEEAPKRRGRNVRIEDYASGFMIKQVEGSRDVEMESVYFDDMKIRAMAFNLAMSTSMWTAIVATESAFRKFHSGQNPVLETKQKEDETKTKLTHFTKEKSKGRGIWLALGLTIVGVLALKHRKRQNLQFNEHEICIDGSNPLPALKSRRRSTTDSFPII